MYPVGVRRRRCPLTVAVSVSTTALPALVSVKVIVPVGALPPARVASSFTVCPTAAVVGVAAVVSVGLAWPIVTWLVVLLGSLQTDVAVPLIESE